MRVICSCCVFFVNNYEQRGRHGKHGFPSLRPSACLECGMPPDQSVSSSLLVGACAGLGNGSVFSSCPFVAPYSLWYSITLPEELGNPEIGTGLDYHLFKPAWLNRLGMQDLKTVSHAACCQELSIFVPASREGRGRWGVQRSHYALQRCSRLPSLVLGGRTALFKRTLVAPVWAW